MPVELCRQPWMAWRLLTKYSIVEQVKTLLFQS
jgi:hypothetical protein